MYLLLNNKTLKQYKHEKNSNNSNNNQHSESMLFIGLLILLFVGILIGLLVYFTPKKLGYPRIAKFLTIGYALLFLSFVFIIAFEDQLFSKSDALELVAEQEIILTDEFVLLKNESSSAIGDYYHTFTLEISERDKQNAISKIKSSDDFKTDDSSINETLYLSDNRYFGPKVTQNYETEYAYVREYFQPSGHEGYAPTFRRISISKTKNELTFEDIDE